MIHIYLRNMQKEYQNDQIDSSSNRMVHLSILSDGTEFISINRISFFFFFILQILLFDRYFLKMIMICYELVNWLKVQSYLIIPFSMINDVFENQQPFLVDFEKVLGFWNIIFSIVQISKMEKKKNSNAKSFSTKQLKLTFAIGPNNSFFL